MLAFNNVKDRVFGTVQENGNKKKILWII